MKKRYSEYVGYNYSKNDEWFNPQVEWDTLLFIDPMLMKGTNIKEFVNSYDKLIDFFSKSIVKLESNLPQHLKENMACFEEVKEANLGFSYDSNVGSGLTGKTALSVLENIKKFVKKGLFGIEDFAEISLFDRNVNGDRITDMILNVLKNDFINYSCRIAEQNFFPVKKFKLRKEFIFDEMRWDYGMVEMPYIVNEEEREIPVLLIPKEFLTTNLYFNDENLMDWIYHNDINYIKDVFDYNLKTEILKNKKKIMEDIINNNRDDLLKKYAEDATNYKAYDLDEDKEIVNKIYEIAQKFYHENRSLLLENKMTNATLPVKDIAELLIRYLQVVITDKKGYELLKASNNKFITEPKISKFVHILFDARIKDAGFNVDISPETNSGNGPVDFKISRGDDKVLIENKVSTNPKLLECIDKDKQIHTYLKQEECKNAFLVVFINKENDIDKITELTKKASKNNNNYNIFVKHIDCIKRESASRR